MPGNDRDREIEDKQASKTLSGDAPADEQSAATIAPPQSGSAADAQAARTAVGVPEQPVPVDAAAHPEAEAEFPVQGWPRYRFERFLGEGGMGRVYKAYDPMLSRNVALKFIRGDDPALANRFLQEAKVQARVEHNHVCKVYEVGEVQGKLYISMQYIDGMTLKDAGGRMTLEQKAKAMKEVSDGIHAAHRLGMIHRDMKPTNVMLEHTEDGEWKPYVMDFGLAREVESIGVTMSGAIVGTPQYMAPEQAWGKIREMDRRTDVYSLGATLYELLTDRPPFEGNTTEVLRMVTEVDPTPPRRIKPSVPVDLETIVLKCMEKEPQRRYDSARALAEDLERYLDGEPIQGRRASLTYRALRKAQKHKIAVSAVGLAVAAGLVFGGIALQARWTARAQARWAREVGQMMERAEATMRIARMAPLHDVRSDEREVRVMMSQIESRAAEMGRAGAGITQYALGRGHLALHEYEDALDHLRAAWDFAETREPEVAYVYGQVLGQIFFQKLQEAEQLRDPEDREALKREAKRLYGDPARDKLEACIGAKIGPTAYLEALVSFYGGQEPYEEALARAEGAWRRQPWFYEAKRLAGDVHLRRASSATDSGQYEKARVELERASEAYATAIDVGRSDGAVYEQDAEMWVAFMQLRARQGRFLTDDLVAMQSACSKASQANPDSARPWAILARGYLQKGEFQHYNTGDDPTEALSLAASMAEEAIRRSRDEEGALTTLSIAYFRRAENAMWQGEDPRPFLQHTVATSRRALAANPNSALARWTQGAADTMSGDYEYQIGLDPRPALESALQCYTGALRADRSNTKALSGMGIALEIRGMYEMQTGVDPMGTLRDAAVRYEQALRINPRYDRALGNLGMVHHRIGEYQVEHGLDPTAAFREAIRSFQRAIEISPAATAFNSKGNALLELAKYEHLSGRDPQPLLQESLEAYRQAIRIDPSLDSAYCGIAVVHEEKASHESDHNQDPRTNLDLAAENYRRAIELNQNEAWLYYSNLGGVYQGRAVYEVFKDLDPSLSIRRAIECYLRSSSLNPSSGVALLGLGNLYYVRSEYEKAAGRDPTASLQLAGESLTKALKLDPDEYTTHDMLGSVETELGVQALRRKRSPEEHWRAAESAFGRAVQLNPQDPSALRGLAALHREKARWVLDKRPPDPHAPDRAREIVSKGLANIERAQSLDQKNADSFAIRAGLLALQARCESDPARRLQVLQSAQESLDEAFQIDPSLREEYAALDAEVRGIGTNRNR
ncbi:MAG: protein kinase [Acidobacteriota bacterium]